MSAEAQKDKDTNRTMAVAATNKAHRSEDYRTALLKMDARIAFEHAFGRAENGQMGDGVGYSQYRIRKQQKKEGSNVSQVRGVDLGGVRQQEARKRPADGPP